MSFGWKYVLEYRCSSTLEQKPESLHALNPARKPSVRELEVQNPSSRQTSWYPLDGNPLGRIYISLQTGYHLSFVTTIFLRDPDICGETTASCYCPETLRLPQRSSAEVNTRPQATRRRRRDPPVVMDEDGVGLWETVSEREMGVTSSAPNPSHEAC
ncbi:hypothetical protein TEQG_01522 [Trichophyton equinum CBS 127.97]|uniref:Uncharacterized protein n=1 Tax=Trichophyton equinum (strain ATCC MYA-4606 / CBS 127.97) TaxID=559882 RepID=F2PKR8_TRIEC|nr:hypothetical protein TEQG_01522 [Trichophyton equinum CBS 127.97]